MVIYVWNYWWNINTKQLVLYLWREISTPKLKVHNTSVVILIVACSTWWCFTTYYYYYYSSVTHYITISIRLLWWWWWRHNWSSIALWLTPRALRSCVEKLIKVLNFPSLYLPPNIWGTQEYNEQEKENQFSYKKPRILFPHYCWETKNCYQGRER